MSTGSTGDGPEAGEAEGPVTAPAEGRVPLVLERIEPGFARGERLALVADGPLRVGRAEHNDVRLLTASASREHAVIEQSRGEWHLRALPGKTVRVDDAPIEAPMPLEPGMSLAFGGDRLRVLEPDQASPDAQRNPSAALE